MRSICACRSPKSLSLSFSIFRFACVVASSTCLSRDRKRGNRTPTGEPLHNFVRAIASRTEYDNRRDYSLITNSPALPVCIQVLNRSRCRGYSIFSKTSELAENKTWRAWVNGLNLNPLALNTSAYFVTFSLWSVIYFANSLAFISRLLSIAVATTLATKPSTASLSHISWPNRCIIDRKENESSWSCAELSTPSDVPPPVPSTTGVF